MIEYDYYKILGVSRTANLSDIKTAYRNLAKTYHPDVNNSPKANELFTILKEAYETLSNERKRYIYDIKLNFVNTVKEDAERKKHYYGSSAKNDTYTNFHYDWQSFSKVNYKMKTDEDYFNEYPIFYNSLFIIGMFLGFLIAIVTILGSFNNLWPFPFIVISVPGFILIWGGWKGIMGKETLFNRVLRWFKR